MYLLYVNCCMIEASILWLIWVKLKMVRLNGYLVITVDFLSVSYLRAFDGLEPSRDIMSAARSERL